MLKSIAKFICPSSKKIAESAAHAVATSYNGIGDGKRENIAKYSAAAKKIAEYQAKLDEIVKDGVIDEVEEARIAAALEPMVDAAKEIVFN